MMKSLLILIATMAAVCLGAIEDRCPRTNIAPCTCKTYFDGACIVTCSLSSQADIDKIADIDNLCNGHVHFVLVHSKVSGIPARLWKTLLSSETVDISIKHSGIVGLVPAGENIPDVNTPGSAVIKIDHAKVDQWDWKQFGKFYSGEELTLVIDDTPLPEISSDFSRIAEGRVHKVTIDSTGLTSVPEKLFASFSDIISLSLQNNQLTSVTRSMLPVPANKLEFLHLNGNQLSDIPGDLFSDMPSLEVVYLRDNNIKSLPQELFRSISSNKLQRIDFVRNPWECDCKLLWVLQTTKQHMNLGNCASPGSLAGKKVRDLASLINC